MSLRRVQLSAPAIAAALAIAGCGGETADSGTPTTSATPTTKTSAPASTAAPKPAESGPEKVAIKDFEYDPKALDVQAGTKVSWTNEDVANHTVTFDDDSENLGSQPKGKTVSFTFKKPGTYAYHCDFHPNMHGTVVVK